ncbi:MAG: AraC family transcriptional regulator [[Clostridium] fimetarium]|nr:AraC family transcriptional regulator [Alistipes timonensis]MCM1404819.1 AraC family transcriptional regulator [[Clostridium] fimetarium]
MTATIPLHRHGDLSHDCVHLKAVNAGDVKRNMVEYAHRDDFYIFGIILRGSLRCDIDFVRRDFREGDLQFIRPGQVHRYVSGGDFEGRMLMVESNLVGDKYEPVFAEAALKGVTAGGDPEVISELAALFDMIDRMINAGRDMDIVRDLAGAFIGIIAERFRAALASRPVDGGRRLGIVLELNSLLDRYIAENHSPAFYAEKLNITPAYLGAAVRGVTGWSAGAYIRNEIVLRAKRLLCHTDLSVKEVAASLGFEDSAYFSRLFSKTAGVSPARFRQIP